MRYLFAARMGRLMFTTPRLILIALGLCMGNRAKVWNIGAEGQYIVGALAGAGVAFLTENLTGWWILPLMVLAALAVAALPTDRFFFEGFLPPKETARRARLAELKRIDATLVMFESGSRVQDTLRDLADIMGARDAAICREMTKLHEEVRRAPLSELADTADTLETRGEFVLVIGPPAPGAQIMAEGDLDALLRSSLKRESVKDAVAQAAELSGRPRREIYARALELAKDTKDGDGEN